jgi:hypothetical protein
VDELSCGCVTHREPPEPPVRPELESRTTAS